MNEDLNSHSSWKIVGRLFTRTNRFVICHSIHDGRQSQEKPENSKKVDSSSDFVHIELINLGISNLQENCIPQIVCSHLKVWCVLMLSLKFFNYYYLLIFLHLRFVDDYRYKSWCSLISITTCWSEIMSVNYNVITVCKVVAIITNN